jgi:hypothetical protein
VPGRRRTARLGATAALAGLAVLAPGAASAATKVMSYSPFAADGTLRPGLRATAAFGGTCDTGSFVVAGAFRCSAGTVIRDPCYLDAAQSTAQRTVVVCAADPWSSAVVRLRLTQAPKADHGAPPGGPPWALTLASGRRCVFASGATSVVAGRRLSYVCGRARVLFGRPDDSAPTWRIRQATSAGGAHRRTVAIAVAWT